MKRYDSSFNSENTVSKVVFPPQVNFEFTNIGSILGGVVGIIGEMAIEMSKVSVKNFTSGFSSCIIHMSAVAPLPSL
jgi:hypothetical protein